MRFVWIALAVMAALIVAVVLVGYALPTKHRVAVEATFKASPAAIFALITNVEDFASWRRGVKSVEILAATDGRKRFRETSSSGTITYVVLTSEPNQRMVTSIDDRTLPFGGTWSYEVSAAGAGRTRLRITEDGEVYNPLFRFVSRFIMGHDSSIRTYLASVASRFPD